MGKWGLSTSGPGSQVSSYLVQLDDTGGSSLISVYSTVYAVSILSVYFVFWWVENSL